MSAAPSLASPFQRLGRLIAGVEPGRPPLDLSVGEPRHAVPAFVGPVLAANLADFGRYPPIKGIPAFREAVASWAERRFALGAEIDRDDGVLPLNGSREGLFHAALSAIRLCGGRKGPRPIVLLPNPFYAVYAAGAEAAGAEPVMLPATRDTGFLPDPEDLPPGVLDRTVAAYFSSPANPQGAVAGLDRWQRLIALARRHDFLLFADECYSEIWRVHEPVGVLTAADRLSGGYENVVAFNSLSKRSNLAGARCGFAIGDPEFLRRWAALRNVSAPQVSIAIQKVAVAALADEAHVAENRRLYDAKFAVAEALLGDRFDAIVPPGGFFLWLDVSPWGGGEEVALRLWREVGVKVVPGGYLSAELVGGNPGAAYIRVAMVENLAATTDAMERMAEVLK
jgi:aspartate/methionine/tyrosine aminotransferase